MLSQKAPTAGKAVGATETFKIMSYDIFLFKKAAKEQKKGLEILEEENPIWDFSQEQFEGLKERLLIYSFQIESEKPSVIFFNFKGDQFGIRATLCKSNLAFSSDFSQEGIFEICMTAAEFTDNGEFAVFNPQQGGWENY